MAVIMRGAPVFEMLGKKIIERADFLSAEGIEPSLGIVRVGSKGNDLSYEKAAKKRMKNMHIGLKVFDFPEDIQQQALESEFGRINEDPSLHGILLFRPLPLRLDEIPLRRMIHPYKDVDGMSPANIAGVFAGEDKCFAPCTPAAVMELLSYYKIPISGSRAVVVGRSLVIGKPLAVLLLRENATVTVCHTKTEELASICREADILVAAAGSAKLITADMVKKNAVVVDAGINVDAFGKVCGDADMDSIAKEASAVSPVPGGVGAVTSAVMARHVLDGAEYMLRLRRTFVSFS